MFYRPGNPIAGPHLDHVEFAVAGIAHQLTKPRSPGLHDTDTVGVLLHHFGAVLCSYLAQVVELDLGALIDDRAPHVGRFPQTAAPKPKIVVPVFVSDIPGNRISPAYP